MVLDEKISLKSIQFHFIQRHKCQPHDDGGGTVRRLPKAIGFDIWQPCISIVNFVPIHLVHVRIFHRISGNFDWLVMPEEEGPLKSLGFILLEPWIVAPHFMEIHRRHECQSRYLASSITADSCVGQSQKWRIPATTTRRQEVANLIDT